MFLLDTNVVSELRNARAGRADRNVTAWAAQVSAASALVHGMTVVTCNVVDFEPTGVKIFDPWTDPAT